MRAVTLTLHPAIDRVISTQKLEPGETFDGRRVLVVPSGKGVNTARSLSAFMDRKSIVAVAWIGPQESAWFKREIGRLSGIRTVLIPRNADVATRNAYTFIEESGRETHIKEAMTAPTADEQSAFLRSWKPAVRRGDLIAICGSAPAGISSTMLKKIISATREKSPEAIIADTNGEFLNVAATSSLDGIKGNGVEIGTWLNLKTGFDPHSAAHRKLLHAAMQKSGSPRSVMVTLGARGAVLAADGKLILATPPKGFRPKGCAATGCGDAATAGWMWALMRQLDAAQTVALAVACGTAKTSQDPGKLQKADVVKVLAATKTIHC